MTELISELEQGAAILRKSSFNPVSLSAGVDLLLRFVTLQRPSIHQPFSTHKRNLVARARDFVADSHRCVDKIVQLALEMIKDDAVVMTHSYSRVVTQSLLHAAKQGKRFKVFVTESRPVRLSFTMLLRSSLILCPMVVARTGREDARASDESGNTLSGHPRFSGGFRNASRRHGDAGC